MGPQYDALKKLLVVFLLQAGQEEKEALLTSFWDDLSQDSGCEQIAFLIKKVSTKALNLNIDLNKTLK